MRVLSIMMVDPNVSSMPSEAEIARMIAFVEEMRASGALVDTGGAMPGMFEARVARGAKGVTVTDGPFAEAKEVVGGYALMDVADRAEAIALTERFLEVAVNATSCYLHEVSVA